MSRPTAVELPSPSATPLLRLGIRVAIALALIVFVAVVAYLDRDGYADAAGDEMSLLDAFYYSTVSITTTGYGDVRPESDSARLLTTLLITPARIVFLILLVGTTVEFLAGRTAELYRIGRWRKGLRDHVIVCGYGTKGRAALQSLAAHGIAADHIIVIDEDPEAREAARALGAATIAGDASRAEVLAEAEVRTAKAVVVAPDRDSVAVLITLTARELNEGATIVAAVREEENVHLLKQGGADTVILTSGHAGRLLGLATQAPRAVEVLEDLFTVGEGLDLHEREVRADEVGPLARFAGREPIVAVIRGEETLRFDEPAASELRPGDTIVYLRSHKD